MGARPAKAKTAVRSERGVGKSRVCPKCDQPKMAVVKFVRHSKPSGFFWLCEGCGHEMSTH